MELPRRFRANDPEQLRADLERLSDITRQRLELDELATVTGATKLAAGKLQPVTGDADVHLPDVTGLLSAHLAVQRLDTSGVVRAFSASGQTVNGANPYTFPLETRVFNLRATRHGWWLE